MPKRVIAWPAEDLTTGSVVVGIAGDPVGHPEVGSRGTPSLFLFDPRASDVRYALFCHSGY